jgi:hypothetical protein
MAYDLGIFKKNMRGCPGNLRVGLETLYYRA